MTYIAPKSLRRIRARICGWRCLSITEWNFC